MAQLTTASHPSGMIVVDKAFAYSFGSSQHSLIVHGPTVPVVTLSAGTYACGHGHLTYLNSYTLYELDVIRCACASIILQIEAEKYPSNWAVMGLDADSLGAWLSHRQYLEDLYYSQLSRTESYMYEKRDLSHTPERHKRHLCEFCARRTRSPKQPRAPPNTKKSY